MPPSNENEFEKELEKLIEKSIDQLKDQWDRSFKKETRTTLKGVPSEGEQKRAGIDRD
jgi:hypothetical protein